MARIRVSGKGKTERKDVKAFTKEFRLWKRGRQSEIGLHPAKSRGRAITRYDNKKSIPSRPKVGEARKAADYLKSIRTKTYKRHKSSEGWGE